MKTQTDVESWEAVSRKAYWDRDVPLEKWRTKVSEGHRSYLPDAASSMSVAEFVHYYGVDKFVRDWPALRARLPAAAAKRAGMLDLAWGRLVGGGWNLRPVADFYSMPARRRQFLVQVSKTPGKSIYEVAKALDMQYRRAHDHAVTLVQEGKIRSVATVEGGHRKVKLFPAYEPVNGS
jgi:hypothetical protein